MIYLHLRLCLIYCIYYICVIMYELNALFVYKMLYYVMSCVFFIFVFFFENKPLGIFNVPINTVVNVLYKISRV